MAANSPPAGREAAGQFAWTPRGGITMLEVLVAVTLIAVLLAILLPSTQHSRAASRRLSCQNNLRQVATAVASFESRTGAVPENGVYNLSPYPFLLADLDDAAGGELLQSALADAQRGEEPFLAPERIKELSDHRPPVLSCPSDPVTPDSPGLINARLCRGLNYHFADGRIEQDDASLGLFGITYATLSSADVLDGLSQTALASEVTAAPVRADDDVPPDDPTAYLVVGGAIETTPSDALRASVRRLCERGDGRLSSGRGGWFWSSETGAVYNHGGLPNMRQCQLDGFLPAGEFGPSSYHFGGVNLALADGSARFVSEAIDRSVWQATATIRGGELTSPF